jgi:hypothetical protein
MASPVLTLCIEAFRRNRVPALVLQSFAALLLLLYFGVPAARPFFEAVENLKQQHGYAFSMISTMLFAGAVPWLVLLHRKRIPSGQILPQGVFLLLYWAVQGFMVDSLYRLQAEWFGHEGTLRVLAIKTFIDQGPYNLFYATPVSLTAYRWKDNHFSFSATRRDLRRTFWSRYAAVQTGSWIIWIPAVMMIYSLPPDLQIPLFSLVICFFTLVLSFLTRDPPPPAAENTEPTGRRA